ncbi:MDR family NADP-dependent oxidoreductase [Streptomyces sp. RPT161]|uniref:MDR family NADP-dependent oxidoreductase n=1 Tax=Streptomyces sp. RPT161 TaxID=3015993 RepID=UPI0022B9063D|nr:NADP-dependent oxidoreductase [Streptomyces sp. RPT161]
MNALPRTSREVRLLTRPEGLPEPGHFEVAEVPLPEPGPGEVLVRNRYFSVAALLRSLISGEPQGSPMPPLRPGDTLYGAAVGEVVTAPDAPGLSPGALVSHWSGWREYAAVPIDQCRPLEDVLPDPAHHLSQGAIAYAALTSTVELCPGDTVFVSGGAGSIGSMAARIARLLGAGRVIGSTGSPDKAALLVTELGYDAAVVRGAGPIAEQLAKAAPDGIDVLFDNVGGEQLRAAVAAARTGARFALVGALSGQLSPDGRGDTAPVELDTLQLILKQITMRGFSGFGRPDAEAQWTRRFADWLRSGEITFPHVRVAGLERAPRALTDVIAGRYVGTVIVEL